MTSHSGKSWIRRIPISKRIIVLVLTISIIPILVVGGFGYLKARNALLNISSDYNVKLIDTFCQNMNMKFQEYFRLSDEIMLNSTVRKTLKTYNSMNAIEKHNSSQRIYQDVRSKFTRIADICDIRIVTSKNIPIYSTGYLYLDDTYNNDNFEKIKNHKSSSLWYIAEYDIQNYFVLSRKIQNLASGEAIGYIIIHIKPDTFNNVLSDFDFGENATIMLLDSFGENYCYSKTSGTFPEYIVNAIAKEPDSNDVIHYTEDSDCFINYTTVEPVEWKLITSIPYSYLTDSIQSITFGVIVTMLICIILCIIISRYIWKSISVPLSNMVTYVQKIPDMNFENYLADDSNDELGYMTDAHNKIILKMQEMASQIKEEQTEKRKAEIKMLQAQINPHFLFNTLDSLRFTALMSNAPTVSDGLSSLSHLLRNSIINGNSYVTIKDEVKNIQDYLTLQKIRCGENIEFHTDISEDVEKCMIMKFLLQPMVENSVIHGMSDDESIHIQLTASTNGTSIFITLKDDGKGFDVNKQYDADTQRFKSSKLSGVGLENVKQRLALEYGSRQTFSITSEEGSGTTVTVMYPVDNEKE